MNAKERALKAITESKQKQSAKENLSTEKVDLGIAEEITNAKLVSADLNRAIKEYQNDYDAAIKAINKIKQDLDLGKGESALRKAMEVLKDFRKAGMTNSDVYTLLEQRKETLEGTMRAVFEIERKIKAI